MIYVFLYCLDLYEYLHTIHIWERCTRLCIRQRTDTCILCISLRNTYYVNPICAVMLESPTPPPGLWVGIYPQRSIHLSW